MSNVGDVYDRRGRKIGEVRSAWHVPGGGLSVFLTLAFLIIAVVSGVIVGISKAVTEGGLGDCIVGTWTATGGGLATTSVVEFRPDGTGTWDYGTSPRAVGKRYYAVNSRGAGSTVDLMPGKHDFRFTFDNQYLYIQKGSGTFRMEQVECNSTTANAYAGGYHDGLGGPLIEIGDWALVRR